MNKYNTTQVYYGHYKVKNRNKSCYINKIQVYVEL